MTYVDPNAMAGRQGPLACILIIASDTNGVGVKFSPIASPRRTKSVRDFPTFVPDAISVNRGKWYYEIELDTDGLIQVGAVIRNKFTAVTGRGNGVGDDDASWGYDGSKGSILATKATIPIANNGKWAKGDRIGVGLDMDANIIVWYKNGEPLIHTLLTDNKSKFEVGKDSLTPAASFSGNQSAVWFFEGPELKHLPAGFLPLQLSPAQASLYAPISAPEIEISDPLSIANVKHDLDIAFASFTGAAATDSKELAANVKQFANAKGAFFEYGIEHKLGSFAKAGDRIKGYVVGELPKLTVPSGRNTAEDYMAEARESMNDRRAVAWFVIALAHVYPHSKAAFDLAAKIKDAIDSFDSTVVDSWARLRYVAALEDRKKNKVLDYGLYWQLERFQDMLKKDRSKMSVSQQQDFAKDVTKVADKLVIWRNWFKDTVGDIPFHGAALEEVDAAMTDFNNLFDPDAMEKEACAKAFEACEKKLQEEIGRGNRRIEEALKEFERFPERAEDGMKKLNAQYEQWQKEYDVAVGLAEGDFSKVSSEAILKLGASACAKTDACYAWKSVLDAATTNWEREEGLRLLKREAKEELRKCKGKLNEAFDLVDHYRTEEAIVKLHQGVEAVAELKERPGFLGLDFLDEFFFGDDGYESLKAKIEDKIYVTTKNKACNEYSRVLRGHLDQIKYLMDHYRQECAIKEYHKAVEKHQEILTLSEDYQDEKAIKEAVIRFDEEAPKFLQDYKDRVVSVQARDKVGTLSRNLSGAEDMVNHYRETEALAEAQKVEEALNELRDDPMLGTAAQILEFAEKCETALPAIREKANQQIINREVKEAIRVLEGTYSETQQHFEHYRFEHCLQSLSKYRELGAELEKEARYRGRADVEESLNNFDTRIPEFEKMYREKMARRALDEELRVARGHFGTAEDMFSHHRFDECLGALQKARELVDALADNEQYCDGGDLSQLRDGFVKTSRDETIPAFLAKYTEKVVLRKAQDVAREINSSINTAKGQLDHHQYENFLQSINKAKEQMDEACPSDDLPSDSEPWLVYTEKVTQDCLNNASKEIYELTQDYEQKQFERNVNDMIRALNGPLGEAKSLLGHSRFEDSLSALAKAQEALSALSLIVSPKAADSVAAASKDIQAFQEEYASVTSKRRDNDLSRAVNSEIDTAKGHFSHYRNEDTLKAIQKTRDYIDDAVQQGSAAIQSSVAEWNKQLETLEQEYCERVLAREADQAIAAARSELKFAEDHFSHYREEKALISLNNAREHAAALGVNERINKLPQVITFYKEFNAVQPEWDAKLEARAMDREVTNNVRVLRDALSSLQQAFSHHQDDRALNIYYKIVEELLNFVEDPRLSGHESTILVKADAQKQCEEFLNDYRERVVSKRFNELKRTANHKYDEAVDKLGRSMFSESIESYYEARDICGKIGGDQLLFGYQPAETFIREFAPKLESFRGQIAAKQRDRALENAKREVSSSMNAANEDFNHHRDEASLKQLNKAREFLEVYEREFGSDNFVAAQKAEQATFEKVYSDRVFEAELSRRERKVAERRNASKDALSHHRHEEAIRTITEADDASQELATDDRFLHLDRVSNFLKEHSAASAAQRKEIKSVLDARASADALRNISSRLDEAEQCYAHYRFDESLKAISKGAELIEEAEDNKAVAEGVLAPLLSKIAAFKTKYQTERLAAEVEAQIRAVTAILNNATFLLAHHRHEDCMTALQQARDEATKLSDSKYTGLPSVAKFFAEWPSQFSTIKDQLSEKLFAIRVRDATAAIKSTIREAETCAGHHMSERAIAAIQKTREQIEELRETSDLGGLDAVVAFTAEASATIEALAQRISNELFSREVDDIIRATKSHVDQAENFFGRYAYESSLQEFNSAKEAVDLAVADPRFAAAQKLKVYVDTIYTPFVAAFSKKYADAVLADEARKAAADIKGHLALATLYLDRNCGEKCIEELVAAQESAAETFQSESSMLRTLPIAVEVMAEVKTLHEKISATFLQKDADEIIRTATKIAARVRANTARLLDCGQDIGALREAVAPLLGSDAKKEPVAPIYSAIPLVNQFVIEEMQPLFKSAKEPLYEQIAAVSKTSGPSSGHDFDSDPACLGKTINSRWPQIAVLRKPLPCKNIGPDVHPRYFTGLKVLNQDSKNIAKCIKELEGVIMGRINWGGSGEASCYPFIKDLFEDIDRHLPSYSKGVGWIENEIPEEKRAEDELYQQIKAGQAAWMTAWAETKVHFNAAEKTILRYRAIRKGESMAKACFKECREVSSHRSNQCLQSSKFTDFFLIDSLYDRHPLYPFKWYDFYQKAGSSSPDETVMFTIVSKVATTLQQTMDNWGKDTKDGAFPNAAAFTKSFKDLIDGCRMEHAQLGYRRLCETSTDYSNNVKAADKLRKEWFNALRRYPIARKYAVELGNKYAADLKIRAGEPWNVRVCIVDTVGEVTDADPEEKEEWYAPSWDWVVNQTPAEHKLPFDSKPDRSSTAPAEIWTDTCKKNIGKIVFATNTIEETGAVKNGGSFGDKFNLKDVTSGAGISARAFWPRAFSNYPIAKDKKTGKALYGPKGMNDDRMICQIFLMASIDGKQIENDMEPGNALTMMTQRTTAKKGEVDFYNSTQTCRIRVLADDLDNPVNLSSYWQSVAGRFAYEFSKLAPGEHKVELQLCFRLFSQVENAFSSHPEIEKGKRIFPFHTTPISAPVATGGFTLVVPTEKVPRRSIMPKHTPLKATDPALRASLEEVLLKHLNGMRDWGARKPKREIPMYASIINEAHVASVDTFFVGHCNRGFRVFEQEPDRYGRDFHCVVRRTKADGWPRESVGYFQLEGVTNSCRNPPKDINASNLSGIWVASGCHFEVDARLLSEEDEKLVSKYSAPASSSGSGNA